MSGMLVRKSSPVLVRPPSPPPATTATAGGDTIELSACDKAFVGIPNTALLVFTEPIRGPAESIKRALTHALVHYRPLAGRLLCRADADGDAGRVQEEDDYYIACTGEGVSFVAATTASSIDDVRFFNRSIATSDSSSTPLFLDDLAVYYPTADGDRPLVLLQVTEFSCGGFVLGVTWNHAAADGAGMGQFINAVANLAVGLPSPTVLPVTRQGAVVVLPAPSPSLLDIDRHFRSLDPPPDMAFLDIVVPSRTIHRVRRRSAGQGRTSTMFEAVTAVLWQCRTRAVMSVKSEPGAPTVLCFSADLRRRHDGPKLDGYYGNSVTLQRAVSTSGEVAGGDIVEVVKMIQHAKDRIQIPAAISEKKQQQREDLDRLFLVTYWRNLGFDQVDFGGGKPARVLSCMRGPVGPPVNIITGNGDDGSCNVLSRCLKEHAQPFLHQLATFSAT